MPPNAAQCRPVQVVQLSADRQDKASQFFPNAGASVSIDTEQVSNHLPFPFGPSFPGAEVLVAAGVEGGPGAGVG